MNRNTEKWSSAWTTTKMSLYALVVVALLHTVLSADPDVGADRDQSEDRDPRRYLTKRSVRVCGVKLIEMMKKICNHCYKTRKQETSRPREVTKRDAAQGSLRPITAIVDTEDPPYEINGEQNDEERRFQAVRNGLDALDVLIDKRWGTDSRRPRQQGGVGIANKCCLNQCSYSDLMSYCCTAPSS